MNPGAVNATMSFSAPMTPEQLHRGVGSRPRSDVIARIKSNTKTHRGTPRPLDHHERITGDYEKPNETAASQPRPLDRDTLQELVAADDELGAWHAEAHHRHRPAAPQIRPTSAPRSRPRARTTEPEAVHVRSPSASSSRPTSPSTEPVPPQSRVQSAPSSRPTVHSIDPERTPLRRAPDAILRAAPEPSAMSTGRSDMAYRPRRNDNQGRWPVTAIVVSTLLAALLGGLIAMAATGG